MGGATAPITMDLGWDLTMGLNVALLACVHTVITRAIAVPSTARRTIWISIAALAPLALLVTPYTLRAAGLDLSLVYGFTFGTASWVAAATTVAAVGSRIIFGLRTEAAKVKRLGQYTLEEKIGEGGMGVVYGHGTSCCDGRPPSSCCRPRRRGRRACGGSSARCS